MSSSPTPTDTGQLHGRLAGLSLSRQVYMLAIWPLFEQLMTFLVGTVDLILASRLGKGDLGVAAADALGVAGYVGWLIAMMQGAVAVGVAALVARAIGGGHRRLANAALGQAMLLGVVVGVVMGVFLYLAAESIGRLAGAEDQSLTLCVTYLRILAIAVPFSALLYISAAALRAAGNTRQPFLVMIVVNVVNIVVSLALVQAGYGVAGIAAGTCVAWLCGTGLIVAVLVRGRQGLRLRIKQLRPHWHTARRIFRVGIPNLFESLGMWSGNFLILMIVGRLAGEGLLGSHIITIRIESISFLGGFAIASAAATLTGQYLGANNPRKARQAVMLCWLYATVLMSAFGVVFLLIPERLTWLISDQAIHLETVPPLLWICAWIQPAFAMSIIFAGAMRGAGDTRTTMILTYLTTFVFRLPAAYVVGFVLEGGLYSVWLALCGEWVIRAGLFGWRFFHGGWQRIEV